MTAPRQKSRRGLAGSAIVGLLLVAAMVVAGIWVMRKPGSGDSMARSASLASVERGRFEISVPASGELAAMRQIEIASRVEGRATITYIVDEGSLVAAGDELVRFDDEAIRTRIRNARLSTENAEARLIASEASLKIRRESSASELSLADVDVRLAELALKAWQMGDDVSRRQSFELELEIARKDSDRVAARFEASKDLLADEFISLDEFQRDEIEMIRARSRFDQAVLALQVYNEYTSVQDRERLEADLKKNRDWRVEIEQRNTTELVNLERDQENKQFNLEIEREELAKAERQLTLCIIVAPQDGLVVYASSLRTGRMGRNEGTPPTVGTEVRRNETLIVLPDTSAMVAEVKVNEALTGRINAGQSVVVYSDAMPDQPLRGEVLGVGVLAESGGWRDPNRRDYTVRISLIGIDGLGLKPSMRCKAEIQVAEVEDALFIPVPAVFRKGPAAFVYVPDGGGYAAQPVSIGRSSELYIEVLGGLDAGDRVLTREPDADRITVRIDDVLPETETGPRDRGGEGSGMGGGRPGMGGGPGMGRGGSGGKRNGGRPDGGSGGKPQAGQSGRPPASQPASGG